MQVAPLKNIERIIFYLILLFIPVQLGKHFWPNFSYVSGIRTDYLSPTIYFTDLLILLLFLTTVFKQFKRIRKFSIFNFSRKAGSRSAGQFSIIAIFLLLNIFFSKNPQAGFYSLFKLLEFSFFGLYVAKKLKTFKFSTVIFIFSLGVILESSLAVFQYINQSSLGGLFYFLGERTFNSQTPGIANASLNGQLVLRPYATFPHPNVLAGYLTIAMAMALSIPIKSGSVIKKYILVISMIFGSVALFLTMSRVAIVIWLFVLGFTALIRLKQKVRKTKFMSYYLLFPIFILLGLFVFSPTKDRFAGFNFKEESFIQRQELINASLLMVEKNPLFGVGLNNFLINLPDVQKTKGNIFYLQPVHNIYLLIASETGIIGLGFFLLFVLKTYKQIRRNKFLIHDSKFVILPIVLVLGFFDHYLLTLQQGQLLFSFVFGVVWAKFK